MELKQHIVKQIISIREEMRDLEELNKRYIEQLHTLCDKDGVKAVVLPDGTTATPYTSDRANFEWREIVSVLASKAGISLRMVLDVLMDHVTVTKGIKAVQINRVE